jgi:hypothetical protein
LTNKNNIWPKLDFNTIQPTLETLHQWIQIVGKIRLKTMPWQNHSWHTALYVSPRGFATNSIPYKEKTFSIDLDFVDHKLVIRCSDHDPVSMDLYSRTVADFHRELFGKLHKIGLDVRIHPRPNEMDPAIPFKDNTVNKTYDPQAASDIWRAMLIADRLFNRFRSEFIGKSSPVHLFWGAFDLAVTRFSGRQAPLHPGGMPNMPLDVMQEAYSQEVSSAGFWLGSRDFPKAVFYAYAYPVQAGFSTYAVEPDLAYYSEQMGEYFLDYDSVRNADNPEDAVMKFLKTTYEAAAESGDWRRSELERVSA